MTGGPLILLVALLGAASSEAPTPGVAEAVQSYENGEYAPAVEGFEKAIAAGIASRSERSLARLYLASALLSLKEADRARTVLAALVADDPSATADTAIFPPRLLQLLEESRRAAGPRPAPARDESVSKADLPLAPPPPLLLVPAAPPAEPPAFALALVPFGVGQFANGSPRKGALFLSGELLAYGTFAVGLGVFQAKVVGHDSNGTVILQNQSDNRWQVLYLAALYTGLAITAVGIVDAIIENRSLAADWKAGNVQPAPASSEARAADPAGSPVLGGQ
ncbi:MAG: tetratricopeptide repeat protein [Deltaproteobacteria bacterium]|nr:tetratricopeptide repeat protein [Deltaproteobacteria bacterium]